MNPKGPAKGVLASGSLPRQGAVPHPVPSPREAQQQSFPSLLSPQILHLELFGKVVRDDGGEGREERGQEHTDIPNVDGYVEKMEYMVDCSRGDH